MTDPKIGVEVLLDGPFPALWDSYSKREVMRFMRKRGKDITQEDLARLTKAILAGPQRTLDREMSDSDWVQLRDHAIQLRLYKLRGSGITLPEVGQKELDRIQQALPWEPRGDQSEEFSFFSSSGWGNRADTGETEDFANMSPDKFSEWAHKQEKLRWDCSGKWKVFCKAEPGIALRLLKEAAERGEWFNAPWYDALSQYWENIKSLTPVHKHETALLLLSMPTNMLAHLGVISAWWFELARPDLDKDVRLRLWKHIWDSSSTEKQEGKYNYDTTLNHAGGILASALIDELAQDHPIAKAGENPGFPKALQPSFKMIGDEDNPSSKVARIRLAANLLYLFRIDWEWTKNALLWRMDATKPERFEAALWEGYLWSPRIHDDLLVDLKPIFFRILDKLDSIPERGHSHALQLFVVTAVPPDRGISIREAQEVLQDMPAQHLAQVAWALKDMLSGAGDKASVLWRETIGPWFKQVWPRNAQAKSERASQNLVRMAMETGDAFPDAAAAIEDSLCHKKWGDTLYSLKESGLHKRFPSDVWKVIRRIVGQDTNFAGSGLLQMLDEISQANPVIAEHEDFKLLRAKAR